MGRDLATFGPYKLCRLAVRTFAGLARFIRKTQQVDDSCRDLANRAAARKSRQQCFVPLSEISILQGFFTKQ